MALLNLVEHSFLSLSTSSLSKSLLEAGLQSSVTPIPGVLTPHSGTPMFCQGWQGGHTPWRAVGAVLGAVTEPSLAPGTVRTTQVSLIRAAAAELHRAHTCWGLTGSSLLIPLKTDLRGCPAAQRPAAHPAPRLWAQIPPLTAQLLICLLLPVTSLLSSTSVESLT